LNITGDVYFNIYDRTRSKIVMTRQDKQISEYIYRLDAETDLVAGHLASFENGSEIFNVLQTREELVSISINGDQVKTTARPKLRYSFLSQKLLTEMYLPVSYQRDGRNLPALYVDSTSVTGNRVYLFEDQKGELVASVKNSLTVPGNCKALNPHLSVEKGNYEFVFLCFEQKEFTIRTFDMN
jgi:hypothetical protein